MFAAFILFYMWTALQLPTTQIFCTTLYNKHTIKLTLHHCWTTHGQHKHTQAHANRCDGSYHEPPIKELLKNGDRLISEEL